MSVNHVRKGMLRYERFVKTRWADDVKTDKDDINNWKDRLFIQFLIYCFPVSFIAAVPGIYISFTTGHPVVGIIDTFCMVFLAVSTFARRLKLRSRKVIVIFLFYLLAVFLTANLGYIGPGIFYLFAITILTALIFPVKFSYWSIIANTSILAGFAALIYLKPFNSAIENDYSAGQWIAFSSNLVFLSIVLVMLIHKMFNGLQLSITKKDQLKLRYKTIFETSPQPMWLFDVESLKFLDVNEAAIAQYGYSKEEFLNITIREIRPAQYVKGIEQVVQFHKNEHKFYNDNIVHLKKNGQQINVKIESSFLEFNGYKAKLVLATDITAQVRSRAEIQKSNEKVKQSESNLRAIFDNTNEGFVLLNTDNDIITSNSKARESVIFNKNKIEFEAGRSIFDFVESALRAGFKDLLRRVHNGETIEYDRDFYVNGETKWIHFALTPVFEGGIIAGACITGRDITEHKKYVQTIEMQNKTLREISWIQSHLVRAPLARIMGLITLLSAETNEKEKEEIINLLQVSSGELDEIIKDITQKTTITSKSLVEV
ncbi:PAS domain S-box protein [Mucilaginibacter sp. L3T2-6]|uniref:PAS domain S-box protein n=1 Tax=Mucilaginibacter sp. L3T2-6 TaxID=3062491 RepID=UPI0026772E51|nr:PAS domain S-box protein [Mucilaginibacter sp. L3T2-6]MDO3644323.1 PAS domain S-box protein [Mucilaginibacter sp. L3T2-6]MDV6216774.1 PAS domain S-box protein [Mucilaginibacter sp. L3T2-6]